MSGNRPDVLKVFLGNLKRNVIKPEVQELLHSCNLTPLDVLVPQGKGIAFATFPTPEEAAFAVQALSMGVQHSCCIGPLTAHRGANMGVFIHLHLHSL
jgi:RNA recognition motif-containing protein